MINAALAFLKEQKKVDGKEFGDVYEEIEERYRHRLGELRGEGEEGAEEEAAHVGRFVELSRELLRIERHTVVRLRNEGKLNDEVLRRIEHELDLGEMKLALKA